MSVAQLVVGLLITPLVLSLSQQYEDYSKNKQIPDPKDLSTGEFIKEYFTYGSECLFEFNDTDSNCKFSLFYLVGYVFSIFVLQISLTYVSASPLPFDHMILTAHGS